MRRLMLLIAGWLMLGLGAATAGETAKPESTEDSVALAPVALPVIVDGHIVNYVFVSVKIWLNPGYDAFALRDKEPYFRDALVRAAHRTPFVVKGDYNRIDEAKLRASMQREATGIMGGNGVKSIQVVSQTPQHRIPVTH